MDPEQQLNPTAFPSAWQAPDMSQMGGWSQTDAGQAPVSPEQADLYKKDIQALMDKVKNKFGELNAIKFSTANQAKATQNNILKAVFDSMKQAGIDPSDPQAINDFLAQLQQIDPDLYDLFVMSMEWLLGWENQATEPNAQPDLTQWADLTWATPQPWGQSDLSSILSQVPTGTTPEQETPQSPTWQYGNIMGALWQ